MTVPLTDVVSRDTIPVGQIDPDPEQPRQRVDPAALAELAASIGANGLASPILVRPDGDRYRIVHGERRWRAVTELGWDAIPAEIRDLDDESARWLQLAENLGRQDLSPIEEARAYRVMLDRGLTQAALAERLGKDRSVISQKLRLLDLPAPLALLVDERVLSEGHVRQLLRVKGLYRDQHVVSGDDVAALEPWLALWATPGNEDVLTFELLAVIRPEDWPTGWPVYPAADSPAIRAARALVAEIGQSSAGYPRWALVAYYFATLTVVRGLSVAILHKVIDVWVERIHAALVVARDTHDDVSVRKLGELVRLKWTGHRADLRHAGLDRDSAHIDEFDAWDLGADVSSDERTLVALPSGCQPGGPMYERYRELEQQERERREALALREQEGARAGRR